MFYFPYENAEFFISHVFNSVIHSLVHEASFHSPNIVKHEYVIKLIQEYREYMNTKLNKPVPR